MTMEQLGPSGILILIVIIGIAYTFLKGAFKTLLNLVSLGLAIMAGLFVYAKCPPYIAQYVDKPAAWMSVAVAVIVTVALLNIINSLLQSFGKIFKFLGFREGKTNRPMTVFVGFAVGAMALWGTLSGIRYTGTIAELEYLRKNAGNEDPGQKPIMAILKEWVEKAPLAKYQAKIDPLYDKARVELAKLLVLGTNKKGFQKASNKSEVRKALKEPEIFTMYVNGKEQQRLIEKGDFNALLNDPTIRKISASPEVRQVLMALEVDEVIER